MLDKIPPRVGFQYTHSHHPGMSKIALALLLSFSALAEKVRIMAASTSSGNRQTP